MHDVKITVLMPCYNAAAHSFEDHFLWLQLKKKGKMYNMAEPLLNVRPNPRSFTMDERKRSKTFHQIKYKALQEEYISSYDGDALPAMINLQNNPKSKEGANYGLLAKKFLWNNYNPSRARFNMKKAITLNAFDIKDYLLLVISYLPKNVINTLYAKFVSTK
jgi:hypothetical protein